MLKMAAFEPMTVPNTMRVSGMSVIIKMMKGTDRSTFMTMSSARYTAGSGFNPPGAVSMSTMESANPMATENTNPNANM